MSTEKMSVTYSSRNKRKITVRVPRVDDPCIVCGAAREKRKIDRHHWREEFTFEEIRNNPLLVMINSIPVDFPHHNLANAIREIVDHLQRAQFTGYKQIRILVESMPKDMKDIWMDLMRYFQDGNESEF